MNRKRVLLRLLEFGIFWGIIFIGCNLAILLGVEEKSLFQRLGEIFSGGTIGALAGLGFFLIYGGVGLVSGALHGAIGLISLVAAGGLSGMGVGSIFYVLRDPDKYNFTWPVIIPIVVLTFYIAKKVTKKFTVKSERRLMLPQNIGG